MLEAKELKDINKPNLHTFADGKVNIICNKGLCSIESNVDVLGIQLEFKGNAEITAKLPNSWIMQGNKNTILMFSLQNVPIRNIELFEYDGEVRITKTIVCNIDSKRIKTYVTETKVDWKTQSWDLEKETSVWSDFKENVKTKTATTTKYNLPDYDLPKVDKTKIKTKRRTTTSTSGVSSGGSGGY